VTDTHEAEGVSGQMTMTTPMPPDPEATVGEGRRVHVVPSRLRVEVHEWLHLKAFQERRTMNNISLAAISVYRAEWEAGRTTLKGRASVDGEIVVYNVHLDNDTYAWLRTTARHARSSINALLVAALTRAHADHAEGTTTTDAD